MLRYQNSAYDPAKGQQPYYWRCAVKNREWHNKRRAERIASDSLHVSETYEYQRSKRLEKYGLTLNDYDAMLEEQQGVCAICGGEPDTRWRMLAVDHDHATGKVRGLLCMVCNTMIGRLENRMEMTLKYLGIN